MRTPSRQRRVGLSALVALVVAATCLVIGAPNAGAVDITSSASWVQVYGTTTSVDVTPFPAASNTGTVSVALTGMTGSNSALINGPGSAAASLCGNFLTDGVTPITPAMKAADSATNTYCDTASDIAQIVFLDAVAGAVTFNYTLRQTGIGGANTQCLSGGQIPCTLGIGSSEGAVPPNWAGTINIFGGPPPPSTAVTPAVQAARPGAALSFTGVDFTASVSTGTASLCDSNGTSNCVALDSATISTDAAGALTGSGTIPAAATTGARRLVVSTGSGPSATSASSAFTVLDTPAITLSASSGSAGGSVSVSGTNFDPGVTLFVSPTDGAAQTGTFAVVVPNATGSFSGASVTTNTGTVAIVATVQPPDGVNFASADFEVSANSCTAATSAVPEDSCSISQQLQLPVEGGSLTLSQDAATIAMDPLTLTGSDQTSTGALNQVTVTDARGNLGGWTLTGAVTDLSAGAGANLTIPADQVSWTPACSTVSGNSAEVVAGTAGAIPTNAALCTAAGGGGGGTFHGDADISVAVASSKGAGTYTGTLTLTLTGL
jgi:hypothetical protein